MGTELPKGAQSPPQFSTHVCCDETAGWIKVPLGMEVGLGPGHILLHGKTATYRGTLPNFRPISVVAKRLDHGWINIPLGREVDLGPSDTMLDGTQLPPKRTHSTIFCPYLK